MSQSSKCLDKDAELIELLNEMLAYIPRISYNIFNQFYETTNRKGIERLEKAYPELGLAYQNIHTGDGTFDRNEDKLGVSTISIIATITDMLYGKRLAVLIDEEGYITGFQWYQPPEVEPVLSEDKVATRPHDEVDDAMDKALSEVKDSEKDRKYEGR